MKILGSKAQVFIDSFDNTLIIDGDGVNTKTNPNQKYFVIEKGESSNIPVVRGSFFVSPVDVNSQIDLVLGDKVFIIDEDRFCKTNASFEFSQGSVDVSDDCDPGATISDGIIAITGSLDGLFKYDDSTQEFSDMTDFVVNRFLDIVEDNGDGVYTISPRDDSQVYMLTLLNSGNKAGQIDNWLFTPININSMSMGLGNGDAQSHSLSFSKGEGTPVLYKVPHLG